MKNPVLVMSLDLRCNLSINWIDENKDLKNTSQSYEYFTFNWIGPCQLKMKANSCGSVAKTLFPKSQGWIKYKSDLFLNCAVLLE